jgi:hypothetical protein
MELGALLQLLFGLIATILTLTGLWFKCQIIKSKIHKFRNPTLTNNQLVGCFRRRFRPIHPLLPLHTIDTPLANRRSTYLMEMNITQDWIGHHAAGWSIGQPRVYRVAEILRAWYVSVIHI